MGSAWDPHGIRMWDMGDLVQGAWCKVLCTPCSCALPQHRKRLVSVPPTHTQDTVPGTQL
jgi:hypothetical protein